MQYFKTYLSIFTALFILSTGCTGVADQVEYDADIVIAGGGTSGVAAAIQASRMGADVLLIEQTDWLGGMLTAAGVSATDGNHQMPSGLWGEFRDKLYDHYGGPDELFTGWVSNTMFEPSVGDSILKEMVATEDNLRIQYGYRLSETASEGNRLTEATFINRDGETLTIKARQFIDATEYGDLLASAGADYSIYMETQDETGEEAAPEDPHPYVQDMTYVAILKDYGPGTDYTIEKPENYDSSAFECMCREVCNIPDEELLSCEEVLDYGRLPNDKFMINWPNRGNDYYADNLELSHEERDSLHEQAKDFTRSWVYFMQTEGGFTNLGFADDEFNTEDQFPPMPYIRESRRLVGVDRLYLYDISNPYELEERPVYKTGIAVADYPVDHHRRKNPVPKQIDFPPIPSYNVPYGSLIPMNTDGLIVAEKSISVTNVVNGTTRLQPVVMQIGQAAGAAAAMSIQQNIQPRSLDVRQLQAELLEAGFWLMPYMDTDPETIFFKPIQRVGLSGIMRGEGIPVAWANETRFYPDSTLTAEQMGTIFSRITDTTRFSNEVSGIVTRMDVLEVMMTFLDEVPESDHQMESSFTDTDSRIPEYFKRNGWLDGWITGDQFSPDISIKRAELALLIDRVFDPFAEDHPEIGFPNPIVDE